MIPKTIPMGLCALLLTSCASFNTAQSYNAKRSNAIRIDGADGCFNVWPHPSDPDRVYVRQCEGSEIGQALTEGALSGLTFGMISPDHGASAAGFLKAAKRATNRPTIGLSRVGDGFGATAGFEVFLDPRR